MKIKPSKRLENKLIKLAEEDASEIISFKDFKKLWIELVENN